MTSWIYLAAAILAEVIGTVCLKLSEGFRRPGPSALMLILYTASVALLTLAIKKIPVSVAYAVWSGIGTALIAVIGAIWFREAMTAMKVACLGLIIVGVVGLNLSSGGQ